MTEDERRNRNPAVEVTRTTREALEAAHPIATASELELHRVYLLMSQRWITTLNYMGTRPMIHPKTLDTIVAHHFHGPRAKLDVFLVLKPGGKFEDSTGREITVRRWMGEDQ